MPDDDDDLAREHDQREVFEARQRRLIEKVTAERRDDFWLRLGHDLSTPSGFERLKATLGLPALLGIEITDKEDVRKKKEALAWAVRAQERAATIGKRLLGWITAGIGIIGGLMGIAKYLQDWRGH